MDVGLVLMKIEPEAKLEALPITRTQTNKIENIQIYGWILLKNETGNEVMNVASFAARTRSSPECTENTNNTDDSVLCLTVSSEFDSEVNQMTFGSPVVVRRGGQMSLLGVAQFEQPVPRSPLYAYSLATHAAWIDSVIGNK
ncbi:uncharacterized protein [Battus philenor]|uniref:uncharacterized protein n=1 Tax=Battus philenor TaxID=42288 RepID=UPI0035CF6454